MARNPDELVAILRQNPNVRLLAIDGGLGAGKSYLAESIAACWPGTHLDIDDFVEPLRGVYVDALQTPRLRDAIASADGSVVLGGVCMREVLERACITDAFHVYIKRMAHRGWADEAELYADGLEKTIASSGRPKEYFKYESLVRDYHRQYRPDDHADVIYEWVDVR